MASAASTSEGPPFNLKRTRECSADLLAGGNAEVKKRLMTIKSEEPNELKEIVASFEDDFNKNEQNSQLLEEHVKSLKEPLVSMIKKLQASDVADNAAIWRSWALTRSEQFGEEKEPTTDPNHFSMSQLIEFLQYVNDHQSCFRIRSAN